MANTKPIRNARAWIKGYEAWGVLCDSNENPHTAPWPECPYEWPRGHGGGFSEASSWANGFYAAREKTIIEEKLASQKKLAEGK